MLYIVHRIIWVTLYKVRLGSEEDEVFERLAIELQQQQQQLIATSRQLKKVKTERLQELFRSFITTSINAYTATRRQQRVLSNLIHFKQCLLINIINTN